MRSATAPENSFGGGGGGANGADVTPDHRPVVAAGLIGLAAILVLTQLDAVAHRFAGWLPVSPFELLLVALVGLTIVLLAAPVDIDLAPLAHPLGLRLTAALALWMAIALAMSDALRDAMEYTIRTWGVMALVLLVPVFVRSAKDLRLLILAVIAAGALNALIVIFETFTATRLFATSIASTEASFEGAIRSTGGSDLNPTSVAQMIMVSALLALVTGIGKASVRQRLFCAAAFLPCTAAIALMSARSAIIGLALGMGIVLFSFYRDRRFPLFVLGSAVAAVAALFVVPQSTFDRFAAIADFSTDRSLFRRLTYLNVGWDLFKTSPIWGIGPGNFPSHYIGDAYRYLPGRTLNARELHNTYLDVLVEYGAVGFALFAGVVTAALRSAAKAVREGADEAVRGPAFAIMTALIALLAASVFMPHKDFRYLWIFIGLALCCRGLVTRERMAA